jgi:glycosyltransferase involved in cell wall biosynthesis
VVQDHGSRPPDPRHPIGALAAVARRAGLWVADGFLFTAARQAEPWRRGGVIGARQVVYEVQEASTAFRPVPPGAARRESGVDGSPAVLWVGRLNANKDPLMALEGFERSVRLLPHARLTMVFGAGDLLAAVRRRVSGSAALASRVRLAGPVPHDRMPAFYSAADLFLLGSHHEGSGYALIEACACGASPVVTDIPSFRAMTGGGRIGALWAPGDAAACARALVAAGRRDRLAERGRVLDHFEQALSWSATGRRAMEAYAHAAAGRRTVLQLRRDSRVWTPLSSPPSGPGS